MSNAALKEIISSSDIRSLKDKMTRLLAKKEFHSVIEGENLIRVIDAVLEINDKENDELLSAAVLGRLAAVARSRKDTVYAKIPELFNEKPESIETLADPDEKRYASVALRYSDTDWLTNYCFREAFSIDSAGKARRELFKIALDRSENVSQFLESICDHKELISSIEGIDKRATRIRRVFRVLVEILNEWKGECGSEPGEALNKCFGCLMKSQIREAKEEILFDIINDTLKILQRIIALRLSDAFKADTYKVIETCRRVLGPKHWSSYLSPKSGNTLHDVRITLHDVRITLLESVIVLARQERTDNAFISLLADVYGGRSQINLKRYFDKYPDIDPETKDWWVKAGDVKKRHVEHEMGSSEDQQIGALMIEVEDVRQAMEKLERAIIPFLEMHDPVYSSTAKKALAGYVEISRISKQLGRMRKLAALNLKGERMEYNPQIHEMLGGHKPGIRNVKVVRDGVKKVFAGKTKTFVKCWVEPDK